MANKPTIIVDVLGKNITDVMLKRQKQQIPKAKGLSAGALLSFALPVDAKNYIGKIKGRQIGLYFFPDNCELAAFDIKAGNYREKNKNTIGDQNNTNKYITDDRIDGFALFEDPSNFPKTPNPLDGTIIDNKLKKDAIEKIPEGVGEGGIYSGAGFSLEYAEYKGNSKPGSADAFSFKGIFHTLMVGVITPKNFHSISGSVYVGAEKWENGNWVGFTYGFYGPASGVASVDWNYDFISSFKIDTNPIGKCICEELIKHVL